jgi:hypothetical protein
MITEDFANGKVYFGIVVYDDDWNPTDELRIYIDETQTMPRLTPDYEITVRTNDFEENCLSSQ